MRLVRTTDREPGITRRRAGRGFCYRWPDGETVRTPDVRTRIHALAIPPAYERVWICPRPEGHLQATGRDAAARKQYRYHPDWTRTRAEALFHTLPAFADALPRLRRRVDDDLKRPGLDRERIAAAAVRLLELTLVRAGHGAGQTGGRPTFGLATLRSRHVELGRAGTIRLDYRGKSGKRQTRTVGSPRVAGVLRRSLGLPGERLLTYEDEDGRARPLDADDLNAYLRNATGAEFTAKHFRTWGGTLHAAATLARQTPGATDAGRRRQINEAVTAAARALGNRPATCRKHYIAPAVFDAFEARELTARMNARPDPDRPPPRRGLGAEERALKKLLRTAG